jgi:tetratricopeptide (TPR) repeat protein
MNAGDAMLWNNRGWTYNNLRQYERALQDLDQAIRLNARLAEAYNNRGVSYNGMRQYDRAIQEYDEAIRLKPGYPVAMRNRDMAIRNRDQARSGSGGITTAPTPPAPPGPAAAGISNGGPASGGTNLLKERTGEIAPR